MPEQPETITFDDFLKVKLKVAKVLDVTDHPDADKLLVLKVDLGTEQRQVVAGIKKHYRPEDLVGKNIIVVQNLAPRKMRGYESQGMLLAACTPGDAEIVLLTTERDIPPGSSVS
ncbi:MAG: methionine--tRNA ligase subunit beta [Phycisphaerales bacterium]|nr:MAG: methionine--tRNA ligase subunit beta [Phycisphaerales bacterium]